MIYVLTITILIFFYVKLKLCMKSFSPFISTRSFLTNKTLMMFHIRGSSRDQLTLPQGVFSLGFFFFQINLEHFLCLFVFILLKGFFVPAEHISIEVSFFWERKRDKGNLGFGCGDVLFWFFPFQIPYIWKIITWWKKNKKRFCLFF